MGLAKISGGIAHYPWGGTGALSELLGWPRSLEPEAEWWLGTHPLRPSALSDSGESVTQWLEQHGEKAELPFLFKILAPVSPLSLQVHPTTIQAIEGYQREEDAGIDLESPHRNYKDRSAKPELVVALDRPFHALAGLRDPAETIALFKSLDPDGSRPMLRHWCELLSTQPLGEVIRWLLSGGSDVRQLVEELQSLAPRNDTLQRLVEHYPGDPGIAVAMMLHRVTLQPGEALFLDAGQLHAYLEGVAIEVMAPSDNVLRGGLTTKHIDVDELLAVSSNQPGPPPHLAPRVIGGVSSYEPSGHRFGVHTLRDAETPVELTVSTPALWVVTKGHWRVSQADERCELTQGEAAVMGGVDHPVTLQGTGQIWWATAR